MESPKKYLDRDDRFYEQAKRHLHARCEKGWEEYNRPIQARLAERGTVGTLQELLEEQLDGAIYTLVAMEQVRLLEGHVARLEAENERLKAAQGAGGSVACGGDCTHEGLLVPGG